MTSMFKKALAVVALSGAAFAAQPAAADVSWNFSVGVGSTTQAQHYSPWGYRPYWPHYRPHTPYRPHWPHGGHRPPRPQLDEAFCVAVGQRGYGHGPRIRGTRSRAEVHVRRNAPQHIKNARIRQACAQAMNECRVKLRTHGGPYAICSVVNRGVQQ